MKSEIHGQQVYGVDVDGETRCAHYKSALDIIAIKFKCCGKWFPCFECHAAIADHEPEVWPENERNTKAVLCGACGYNIAINEYLACGSVCTKCSSRFNPGCANHRHLYFA